MLLAFESVNSSATRSVRSMARERESKLYFIDVGALPFKENNTYSGQWARCANCMISLCCQDLSGQFCSPDCSISYRFRYDYEFMGKELKQAPNYEGSIASSVSSDSSIGGKALARVETKKALDSFADHQDSVEYKEDSGSSCGIEF